jgi:UDP-N-acetylmuramoyl-tripeptide--D-alanyl-D-alanine ligase
MPRLDLGEIAAIVGAKAASPLPAGPVAGYGIDTRLLAPGEVFFALKGETRDGHGFVKEAWEKGAAAAVVESPIEGLPWGFPQLAVKSSLEALQKLASHVRGGLAVPVVSITGSNGKTTTKEMIAHLIASRMRVRKSPGNFNNHIGLPLSILSLEDGDQVLVVEMGSNHSGEIAALCRMARPDVGVITNVGRAHVGLFGSLEAIAEEKTDLARGLAPGGKVVANADDPTLMAALKPVPVPVTTFGIVADADLKASDVRAHGGEGATFTVAGARVALRAQGVHNVYNALAAIAVAGLFGVTPGRAAELLPGYEPMRMKTAVCGGVTVIDDTYNANPDSVAAALQVLAGIEGARRVFVMGDMMELGAAAQELHREVGARVARSGIEVFVAIGEQAQLAADEARAAMDAANVHDFATRADARRDLARIIRPGDVVLVKASRASQLEEIVDLLRCGVTAGGM